jgi:hypothetical protein
MTARRATGVCARGFVVDRRSLRGDLPPLDVFENGGGLFFVGATITVAGCFGRRLAQSVVRGRRQTGLSKEPMFCVRWNSSAPMRPEPKSPVDG